MGKKSSIPCPHVISGIFHMGYKMLDYIDESYLRNTYLKTYSHVMQPWNAIDEWPKANIEKLLPLIIERMPGRPKKNVRIKSAEEIVVARNKLVTMAQNLES